MKKKPVLAIIGGGASGILSAIFAKKILSDKADVIIIDRMDRIGKKILATGNGRCNFTNMNTSVYNFYGKNPKFAEYALNEFTVYDTLDFFEKLGIYPLEEENGKMYPFSGQATAILDVLRNEIDRLSIKVITQFYVDSIKKQGFGFKIFSKDNKIINADKVIIDAGGCASANLGSDGSGFDILKNMGHSITKLNPALVQLRTPNNIVKGLKGIKFNGNVKMFINNKYFAEESGEVLFTDYGLSGPPIFQLSTVSAIHKNCKVELDFIPMLSEKDVAQNLSVRKKNLSHLTMENFFVGLLNKRIGNVIAKQSGIEKLSFPVSNLNKDIIEFSTIEEKGLDELYNTIENMFKLNQIDSDNSEIITNERQKQHILKAIEAEEKAMESAKANMPSDITAIAIKQILEELAEITGQSASEDIINEIFKKFCLGK